MSTANHRAAPVILVVDDSNIVLEMTRATLEAAGYHVITRARGSGTVEAVLQEKPDLVLLDVKMPRFNGDTIARILTKTERKHRTIVLLFSSCAPSLLAEKVQQTGADGYIQKTANGVELVQQVTRWLRDAGKLRDPQTGSRISGTLALHPLPPTPSTPSPRAATHRPAAVLFVDDDTVAQRTYRAAASEAQLVSQFTDSPEHALRLIRGPEPPDVVVSSPTLSGPSGVPLFRAALNHDRSWRRRFVLVTGSETLDEYGAFLASVRDQVLYKPVQRDSLIRALRFASIASRVFSSGPVPVQGDDSEKLGGI